MNAYLCAGMGRCRDANVLQRHGQQRDGDLLACREQHIHFTRGGVFVQGMRHIGQAVGFATHRRDDDDDLVPLVTKAFDLFRHGFDTVDRAHRSAAELLYV